MSREESLLMFAVAGGDRVAADLTNLAIHDGVCNQTHQVERYVPPIGGHGICGSCQSSSDEVIARNREAVDFSDALVVGLISPVDALVVAASAQGVVILEHQLQGF